MKKNIIKILCVLISVFIIVPSVFAESIDSLKDKQQLVIDKQNELEKELDTLKGNAEEAEKYKEVLVQQILLTQENIDSSVETIAMLEDLIADAEERIKLSEIEHKDTIERLKARVIALYTSGQTSTLEILLNSTSLYDFSMRTTALETVAEHDKKLIEEIQAYADETREDREFLIEEKANVVKTQEILEKDIENLDRLVRENLEVIENISANENSKQEILDALKKEEDDYEKKIQQLIKEQEEASKPPVTTTPPTTTTPPSVDDTSIFDPCFPVPGYEAKRWQTSPFGPRWGSFHWGYDIAAPSGIPIVATDSGKVVSAQYHYSWGNNVLIYHNSTYSTRSAHMSRMAVSAGQYVEKGQIIGYIGTTGDSNGNHLHFEVYKNGTRVDPFPFIGKYVY